MYLVYYKSIGLKKMYLVYYKSIDIKNCNRIVDFNCMALIAYVQVRRV
jgi:hypothetical protein